MHLNEEASRGEQARLLLDSPIYQESYQLVRDAIIAAWESAPIRDKEGHNELKLMLKLLADVRRNIENTMQTGKLAKVQIERDSLMQRTASRFK